MIETVAFAGGHIGERHAAAALERLARARQRDAQAQHPHAAEGLQRVDAIEALAAEVTVDQVRFERAHRGALVAKEVHHALEAVLLVLGIDGKVGSRVELLPFLVRADPRLGAVVDRHGRRLREERGHLEEVVRDARQDLRRQRAAHTVEPHAGEIGARQRGERHPTARAAAVAQAESPFMAKTASARRKTLRSPGRSNRRASMRTWRAVKGQGPHEGKANGGPGPLRHGWPSRAARRT